MEALASAYCEARATNSASAPPQAWTVPSFFPASVLCERQTNLNSLED